MVILGQCWVKWQKKALEKPYITRLFEGAASFILNRSRRFAGDVIEDSVDMRHFIDDP